ncbi:DUF4811 domain-containing protein [Mammaliicoccus sciuri]|uniref:DUF4811 domain-containing protein n=1 Tax=Mammaliicoccus sciuri TaxID=1296 RepID=UPI001950629A|nr:DUF4811 domain-containing protein [Mammaliicoccus sciuri]MEB6097096.1 DUF4811 domain-containing protein [Mammaliicoccus sciuri]MEB6207512.1 DUF4811 domain-containing protein [Mammaliicoccus sciuri]
MIITIILTLCTFVSWLLIPHKITRYLLGTLFTLALALTIIVITANITNHWGMEKKVITSSKKEIFTGGPKNNPANMLIINEIGKDTNNYVMVFRDHPEDKEATTHFKPKMDKDNISESVKHQAKYEVKNTDKATQQTQKEVWVWKSDLYQSLLSFGENDNELIQSTTTVIIPEDTWVIVDAKKDK